GGARGHAGPRRPDGGPAHGRGLIGRPWAGRGGPRGRWHRPATVALQSSRTHVRALRGARRTEEQPMAIRSYDQIYLGGAWVPSSGSESIDVIDSTTEEVMARVPAGTAGDVDRA